MILKKECDLVNIIRDLGSNFLLGKHTIHNTQALITEVKKNCIKAILPYGEGFSVETYNLNNSNKPLNPNEIQVIDAMHYNHSKIKAQYQNNF